MAGRGRTAPRVATQGLSLLAAAALAAAAPSDLQTTFSGRLTLSVDDPAGFASNSWVRDSLRNGLAAGLTDVTSSMVSVMAVEVASSSSVKLDYEILIIGPVPSGLTASSIRNSGSSLRSGITGALGESGLSFSVSGITVGSPKVTTTSPSATPSPTLSPTPSPTPSPTAVRFELRTTDKCQANVTSMAACRQAAEQLGLSDTTPSDDGQSGVSYDPPYCYFESNSLKFNSNGRNSGSCSSSDKCLCQERAGSTSSSRFMLKASGRCATSVTSTEECAEAARQLGLSDTTPSDDGQSGASYDPPYCYFESNSLKFNSNGSNSGSCSSSDKCLCQQEGAASANSSRFTLKTSGRCVTNLTSMDECAEAARRLRLSDTTPSDDGQSGVSYDPPYCYYEDSSLKFNSNGGNTGSCTSSDQCLCPAERFVLRTRGTCGAGGDIYSLSECSQAAEELGLGDVSASDDAQASGVSYDPPYCYFESGSLKHNTKGLNTGACTSTDQCLCRWSETGTASRYALRLSGFCGTRVTSLADCSAAARELGLGDTSATDDKQSGVSYDPPYCYYESSSLKYNSNGRNTGSCSSSDKCLCIGTQAGSGRGSSSSSTSAPLPGALVAASAAAALLAGQCRAAAP